MSRAFVVVGEAASVMTDLDRCLLEVDQAHWHGLCPRVVDLACRAAVLRRLALAKNGIERILREDVFNVGEQQFLVLLLVLHAKNQDRLDFLEKFFVGAGKEVADV